MKLDQFTAIFLLLIVFPFYLSFLRDVMLSVADWKDFISLAILSSFMTLCIWVLV